MGFDISLVVPGMPFDRDIMEKRSVGGSESAGYYMANVLSLFGNRVTVYNSTKMPLLDKHTSVKYLPLEMWESAGRHVPHDITIVQRVPEMLSKNINSKLRFLWCHDLPDARDMEKIRGIMWNIDKVFTLSKFMTDAYIQAWKLEDSELFQTRNGIDIATVQRARAEIESKPRDRKKLMYCARPERGLDVLLSDIFPKLLSKDNELTLHIATYDNKVQHMKDFYNYCDSLAHKFGDRVVQLGSLTKLELYKHYLTAGVYVYPTPSPVLDKFREVSCITAMEVQACGLPMVTTNMGALPETLHVDAGRIVELKSEHGADIFVDSVMEYVTNDAVFNTASEAGIRHAATLDWEPIGADWMRIFDAKFAEVNNDNYRLVRHFWRNSDIVAADKLLEGIPDDLRKQDAWNKMRRIMQTDFGFYHTDEGMREQYEAIGKTHDERVIDWVQGESRYQALKAWLQDNKHQDSRIIDYGCAHGSYAVNLCAETGGTWYGIDIDKHGVELAAKFAQQKGLSDKMNFLATDVMQHGAPTNMLALGDVVLVQEVLEHVREPWTVLERVERMAKPGGTVYITVPFGPWEYESYFNYPHRCHIWHFDTHDIYDMVGKKPGLNVEALLHGKSESLGTPLGWWIITYNADHKPIGSIDLDRKIKYQNPRQTVSVSVMGGPNAEEQMIWTLNSVHHIADEIVFVDTGLNAEGKELASRRADILIQGDDPRRTGFETPRNQGLAACTMDWVMWIDLDERLVGQENVHKYLRENAYNGYGMRQHHFACDTTFSPDIPVRLFRNRPTKDGKEMRFYGMIHEHPELGLNNGPGTVIIASDIHLMHTGYQNETVRQRRFTRNYPLLQADREKYPDRILQKHFIMRDNILLCRYELRQNGGYVSPQMRQLCEEVVELGKKYFIGKKGHMSSDSMEYYSEALGLLGRGFEVCMSLTAAQERATPEGHKFYRFDNKDEFLLELNKRAEDVSEPLTRV